MLTLSERYIRLYIFVKRKLTPRWQFRVHFPANESICGVNGNRFLLRSRFGRQRPRNAFRRHPSSINHTLSRRLVADRNLASFTLPEFVTNRSRSNGANEWAPDSVWCCVSPECLLSAVYSVNKAPQSSIGLAAMFLPKSTRVSRLRETYFN